jgi:asparagine synthase (glutamine-hydrolysing)
MAPQGGDRTFFTGVQLVPAATFFEIDLEAPRPTRPEFQAFWRPGDFTCRPDRLPTFDAAVVEVRALMESSIELQSRAAVPVGCLLSGGLDTSYVARTLANRALHSGSEPARSFSLVFSERDMSELPYIWSVLRPGGLTNIRFQLNPAQAFQDVDTVVGVQGQPLLGQDLIAQYHAYRLARDNGAVVILEGQGADELLGGMPLYAEAMRSELWSQHRFGELALELWADMRRNGHSRLRTGGQIARWLMPSGLHRPQSQVPPWVDERGLAEPAGGMTDETSSDPSLLNQYLFRLVTQTNLPTVLQYQDRSSMAHGIEGRVPFLDHRFVEYCFGLPSSYKVHRGIRKRVLVDAARGLVPDAVLQRRTKKTFISKTKWVPLREHYGPQLREMASGLGAARLPWVNPAGLQSYVDDFLAARHDDVTGVWRAYTAWRWIELFGVRQ